MSETGQNLIGMGVKLCIEVFKKKWLVDIEGGNRASQYCEWKRAECFGMWLIKLTWYQGYVREGLYPDQEN